MPNTSSSGGFLIPSVSPLEGQALLNFLQGWIVGITAYPGQYVRPRWQAEPGNLPDASIDWMSFGIMSRDADPYPYEVEDPTGTFTQYIRHETLNILLSFYGPNADAFASQMREGMFLPQNNEYLVPQSIDVLDAGTMKYLPELIKFRWLNHIDLPIALRRKLIYNYEVQSLLSATGTVTVDNGGSPTGIAAMPVLTINT